MFINKDQSGSRSTVILVMTRPVCIPNSDSSDWALIMPPAPSRANILRLNYTLRSTKRQFLKNQKLIEVIKVVIYRVISSWVVSLNRNLKYTWSSTQIFVLISFIDLTVLWTHGYRYLQWNIYCKQQMYNQKVSTYWGHQNGFIFR